MKKAFIAYKGSDQPVSLCGQAFQSGPLLSSHRITEHCTAPGKARFQLKITDLNLVVGTH